MYSSGKGRDLHIRKSKKYREILTRYQEECEKAKAAAPAVATVSSISLDDFFISASDTKEDQDMLRQNVKRASAATAAARGAPAINKAIRKENAARQAEARYITTLQQTGLRTSARMAALSEGGVPMEIYERWSDPETVSSTSAPIAERAEDAPATKLEAIERENIAYTAAAAIAKDKAARRNAAILKEDAKREAAAKATVPALSPSYERAVETEAKYKATFQDNLERAAKEKGVSFEAILRDNTAMEGALAAARAAALAEEEVPVGLASIWGDEDILRDEAARTGNSPRTQATTLLYEALLKEYAMAPGVPGFLERAKAAARDEYMRKHEGEDEIDSQILQRDFAAEHLAFQETADAPATPLRNNPFSVADQLARAQDNFQRENAEHGAEREAAKRASAAPTPMTEFEANMVREVTFRKDTLTRLEAIRKAKVVDAEIEKAEKARRYDPEGAAKAAARYETTFRQNLADAADKAGVKYQDILRDDAAVAAARSAAVAYAWGVAGAVAAPIRSAAEEERKKDNVILPTEYGSILNPAQYAEWQRIWGGAPEQTPTAPPAAAVAAASSSSSMNPLSYAAFKARGNKPAFPGVNPPTSGSAASPSLGRGKPK